MWAHFPLRFGVRSFFLLSNERMSNKMTAKKNRLNSISYGLNGVYCHSTQSPHWWMSFTLGHKYTQLFFIHFPRFVSFRFTFSSLRSTKLNLFYAQVENYLVFLSGKAEKKKHANKKMKTKMHAENANQPSDEKGKKSVRLNEKCQEFSS